MMVGVCDPRLATPQPHVSRVREREKEAGRAREGGASKPWLSIPHATSEDEQRWNPGLCEGALWEQAKRREAGTAVLHTHTHTYKHNTTQHSTTQHSTAQHSTTQNSTT
eukprot:3940650-Rhodomonas_salina.2